MASSDDVQPSAKLSAGARRERVRLEASISKWAPIDETRQQVMLKLVVASSSAADRLGLDLVAVLDVSGEKLAKVKTAMHFIISKLRSKDRLHIVGTGKRLQYMTEAGRAELRGIVDGGGGLEAGGSTNGLQTGLDVLAFGRLADTIGGLDGDGDAGGRTASVLLMSDCKQHPRPMVVETGDVVVHTFGFGQDHDLTVLEEIASNSRGGTFNFVRDDWENLSGPISQILAGLLSVVVQGVKLTMWTDRDREVNSTIEKVDAGSCYPPARDADGRVTVSFGDLYIGEDRKVIVDLLLPAVSSGDRATIIIIARCSHYYTYYYKSQVHFREVFDSPKVFQQDRSLGLPGQVLQVPPALKAELVRRRHADMLREAASTMDYAAARGKLVEASKALDAENNPNNRMIGILEAELKLLGKLDKWAELHACLLAAIMSHCRQRFAARGNVMNVRLFDTPLMRMYLVQAHKFDDDPALLPPSAKEDFQEEDEEEKERPVVEPELLAATDRSRISGWAWVEVILCTVLAIGPILAGVALLAVFLLYKPNMPYLVVSDAHLGQLLYRQDGTIQSLRVSITILANNNNSKVGASFSSVDIALGFHGADVALLRAEPFVVAPESSIALHYHVVLAGPVLDAAAMNESLKLGLVPLDLFSKARTRWKAGIFIKLTFSTRIACRLRFFFPGNGTVMPIDRDRCHSRSP